MKRGNILAHRGVWSVADEKNTLDALSDALRAGFGIETDIRDRDGVPVVSHDPASAESPVFATLLELCGAGGRLALNVKADGLRDMIEVALRDAGIDAARAFVFDMSVPDMLAYARGSVPLYTRLSEHEPVASLRDAAAGVWVDDFSGTFDQIGCSREALDGGLEVALVSPELHGRDHSRVWQAIRDAGLHEDDRFALCTDHPHEAATFFDARS